MRIKKTITLFFLSLISLCITCCNPKEKSTKESSPANKTASIQGTWKLISGTTIKGKDTIVTDYTKGQEMIKIINKTHFTFLRHDLKKGKDSTAIFVAGGGKYSIKGKKYIENLQYFNIREWEGNTFEFEYTINVDTLVTQGIEKIEELGINYYNIEKYQRIKN
ncbi:hypothetical protein ACSIGC_06925 [Tenacibaculum sp. ZS6-P6]|uniref:hypothetical protein n=1 Tax=Tenacibaculum sp. ZS6-P6 TaxID=3447503 RepID=UPI003F97CA7B